MQDLSDPIEGVFWDFSHWPEPPPKGWQASVHLFLLRLPATEVLEAALIAESRIPYGGRRAFLYFCKVCHNRIKERTAKDSGTT